MQLPPPSKNSSGSTDIKTLSTISPSSCTKDIFDKTPDLQKLGIRGNLVELLETKGGISLFDNIQNLDHLENLKLINDALDGSILQSFPGAEKFPRRLRIMTLWSTSFDWKDMCILGSLDELEVLKLEENAFVGEVCDVSNIVFKRLQYLRIGRTDLVSWIASKDGFPVLKYLILRHCTVPLTFGEVESLKMIDLFATNEMAANSAREIQDMKIAAVNDDAKKGGFELSIYPPDH